MDTQVAKTTTPVAKNQKRRGSSKAGDNKTGTTKVSNKYNYDAAPPQTLGPLKLQDETAGFIYVGHCIKYRKAETFNKTQKPGASKVVSQPPPTWTYGIVKFWDPKWRVLFVHQLKYEFYGELDEENIMQKLRNTELNSALGAVVTWIEACTFDIRIVKLGKIFNRRDWCLANQNKGTDSVGLTPQRSVLRMDTQENSEDGSQIDENYDSGMNESKTPSSTGSLPGAKRALSGDDDSPQDNSQDQSYNNVNLQSCVPSSLDLCEGAIPILPEENEDHSLSAQILEQHPAGSSKYARVATSRRLPEFSSWQSQETSRTRESKRGTATPCVDVPELPWETSKKKCAICKSPISYLVGDPFRKSDLRKAYKSDGKLDFYALLNSLTTSMRQPNDDFTSPIHAQYAHMHDIGHLEEGKILDLLGENMDITRLVMHNTLSQGAPLYDRCKIALSVKMVIWLRQLSRIKGTISSDSKFRVVYWGVYCSDCGEAYHAKCLPYYHLVKGPPWMDPDMIMKRFRHHNNVCRLYGSFALMPPAKTPINHYRQAYLASVKQSAASYVPTMCNEVLQDISPYIKGGNRLKDVCDKGVVRAVISERQRNINKNQDKQGKEKETTDSHAPYTSLMSEIGRRLSETVTSKAQWQGKLPREKGKMDLDKEPRASFECTYSPSKTPPPVSTTKASTPFSLEKLDRGMEYIMDRNLDATNGEDSGIVFVPYLETRNCQSWKCESCTLCVYCCMPIRQDLEEKIYRKSKASQQKTPYELLYPSSLLQKIAAMSLKTKARSAIEFVRCVSCNVAAHKKCCNPVIPELSFLESWRCEACLQCICCGYRDSVLPDYMNWGLFFLFCLRCWQSFEKSNYCGLCYRIWTKLDNTSYEWVQCDGCKLWVHIECDPCSTRVAAAGNNKIEKYKCPACRSPNRLHRLFRVLEVLFNLDRCNQFRYPLTDANASYSGLVSRPMDLLTIKAKLEAGSYYTFEQFAFDVLLMSHNAMILNMPNTKVYKLALHFGMRCKIFLSTILDVKFEDLDHILQYGLGQAKIETFWSKIECIFDLSDFGSSKIPEDLLDDSLNIDELCGLSFKELKDQLKIDEKRGCIALNTQSPVYRARVYQQMQTKRLNDSLEFYGRTYLLNHLGIPDFLLDLDNDNQLFPPPVVRCGLSFPSVSVMYPRKGAQLRFSLAHCRKEDLMKSVVSKKLIIFDLTILDAMDSEELLYTSEASTTDTISSFSFENLANGEDLWAEFCMACGTSAYSNYMVFCQICGEAFHYYCIGLVFPPQFVNYVNFRCASCAVCQCCSCSVLANHLYDIGNIHDFRLANALGWAPKLIDYQNFRLTTDPLAHLIVHKRDKQFGDTQYMNPFQTDFSRTAKEVYADIPDEQYLLNIAIKTKLESKDYEDRAAGNARAYIKGDGPRPYRKWETHHKYLMVSLPQACSFQRYAGAPLITVRCNYCGSAAHMKCAMKREEKPPAPREMLTKNLIADTYAIEQALAAIKKRKPQQKEARPVGRPRKCSRNDQSGSESVSSSKPPIVKRKRRTKLEMLEDALRAQYMKTTAMRNRQGVENRVNLPTELEIKAEPSHLSPNEVPSNFIERSQMVKTETGEIMVKREYMDPAYQAQKAHGNPAYESGAMSPGQQRHHAGYNSPGINNEYEKSNYTVFNDAERVAVSMQTLGGMPHATIVQDGTYDNPEVAVITQPSYYSGQQMTTMLPVGLTSSAAQVAMLPTGHLTTLPQTTMTQTGMVTNAAHVVTVLQQSPIGEGTHYMTVIPTPMTSTVQRIAPVMSPGMATIGSHGTNVTVNELGTTQIRLATHQGQINTLGLVHNEVPMTVLTSRTMGYQYPGAQGPTTVMTTVPSVIPMGAHQTMVTTIPGEQSSVITTAGGLQMHFPVRMHSTISQYTHPATGVAILNQNSNSWEQNSAHDAITEHLRLQTKLGSDRYSLSRSASVSSNYSGTHSGLTAPSRSLSYVELSGTGQQYSIQGYPQVSATGSNIYAHEVLSSTGPYSRNDYLNGQGYPYTPSETTRVNQHVARGTERWSDIGSDENESVNYRRYISEAEDDQQQLDLRYANTPGLQASTHSDYNRLNMSYRSNQEHDEEGTLGDMGSTYKSFTQNVGRKKHLAKQPHEPEKRYHPPPGNQHSIELDQTVPRDVPRFQEVETGENITEDSSDNGTEMLHRFVERISGESMESYEVAPMPQYNVDAHGSTYPVQDPEVPCKEHRLREAIIQRHNSDEGREPRSYEQIVNYVPKPRTRKKPKEEKATYESASSMESQVIPRKKKGMENSDVELIGALREMIGKEAMDRSERNSSGEKNPDQQMLSPPGNPKGGDFMGQFSSDPRDEKEDPNAQAAGAQAGANRNPWTHDQSGLFSCCQEASSHFDPGNESFHFPHQALFMLGRLPYGDVLLKEIMDPVKPYRPQAGNYHQRNTGKIDLSHMKNVGFFEVRYQNLCMTKCICCGVPIEVPSTSAEGNQEVPEEDCLFLGRATQVHLPSSLGCYAMCDDCQIWRAAFIDGSPDELYREVLGTLQLEKRPKPKNPRSSEDFISVETIRSVAIIRNWQMISENFLQYLISAIKQCRKMMGDLAQELKENESMLYHLVRTTLIKSRFMSYTLRSQLYSGMIHSPLSPTAFIFWADSLRNSDPSDAGLEEIFNDVIYRYSQLPLPTGAIDPSKMRLKQEIKDYFSSKPTYSSNFQSQEQNRSSGIFADAFEPNERRQTYEEKPAPWINVPKDPTRDASSFHVAPSNSMEHIAAMTTLQQGNQCSSYDSLQQEPMVAPETQIRHNSRKPYRDSMEGLTGGTIPEKINFCQQPRLQDPCQDEKTMYGNQRTNSSMYSNKHSRKPKLDPLMFGPIFRSTRKEQLKLDDVVVTSYRSIITKASKLTNTYQNICNMRANYCDQEQEQRRCFLDTISSEKASFLELYRKWSIVLESFLGDAPGGEQEAKTGDYPYMHRHLTHNVFSDLEHYKDDWDKALALCGLYLHKLNNPTQHNSHYVMHCLSFEASALMRLLGQIQVLLANGQLEQMVLDCKTTLQYWTKNDAATQKAFFRNHFNRYIKDFIARTNLMKLTGKLDSSYAFDDLENATNEDRGIAGLTIRATPLRALFAFIEHNKRKMDSSYKYHEQKQTQDHFPEYYRRLGYSLVVETVSSRAISGDVDIDSFTDILTASKICGTNENLKEMSLDGYIEPLKLDPNAPTRLRRLKILEQVLPRRVFVSQEPGKLKYTLKYGTKKSCCLCYVSHNTILRGNLLPWRDGYIHSECLLWSVDNAYLPRTYNQNYDTMLLSSCVLMRELFGITMDDVAKQAHNRRNRGQTNNYQKTNLSEMDERIKIEGSTFNLNLMEVRVLPPVTLSDNLVEDIANFAYETCCWWCRETGATVRCNGGKCKVALHLTCAFLAANPQLSASIQGLRYGTQDSAHPYFPVKIYYSRRILWCSSCFVSAVINNLDRYAVNHLINLNPKQVRVFLALEGLASSSAYVAAQRTLQSVRIVPEIVYCSKLDLYIADQECEYRRLRSEFGENIDAVTCVDRIGKMIDKIVKPEIIHSFSTGHRSREPVADNPFSCPCHKRLPAREYFYYRFGSTSLSNSPLNNCRVPLRQDLFTFGNSELYYHPEPSRTPFERPKVSLQQRRKKLAEMTRNNDPQSHNDNKMYLEPVGPSVIKGQKKELSEEYNINVILPRVAGEETRKNVAPPQELLRAQMRAIAMKKQRGKVSYKNQDDGTQSSTESCNVHQEYQLYQVPTEIVTPSHTTENQHNSTVSLFYDAGQNGYKGEPPKAGCQETQPSIHEDTKTKLSSHRTEEKEARRWSQSSATHNDLPMSASVTTETKDTDKTKHLGNSTEQESMIRSGALTILNVGDGIIFDENDQAYPAGFTSVRIFWSRESLSHPQNPIKAARVSHESNTHKLRNRSMRNAYLCSVRVRQFLPYFSISLLSPRNSEPFKSAILAEGYKLEAVYKSFMETIARKPSRRFPVLEFFGLNHPYVVQDLRFKLSTAVLRRTSEFFKIRRFSSALSGKDFGKVEPMLRPMTRYGDSVSISPTEMEMDLIKSKMRTIVDFTGLYPQRMDATGVAIDVTWNRQKYDLVTPYSQYRFLTSTIPEKRLQVRNSSIHGYGLFAAEHISAGDPVVEYVGELIREQVGDLREEVYSKEQGGDGSCYMFRLDEELIVDATRKGSMSRFINHSCDPNCICRIVTCDRGQKHIVVFAKVDLKPGDEVTYDYKFGVEGESQKLRCLCASLNCMGRMN